MNKQSIRQEFLNRRRLMHPAERAAHAEKIERFTLAYLLKKNVSTVMAYAAFREEVETEGMICKLLAAGKTVGLPKCLENGEMQGFAITSLSNLAPGRFGILEPPETNPLAPETVDIVLVPGCAFGRDMSRLGYGRGYYDRYLPLCTKAFKVGLCYNACLETSLPTEPFDVPMDCIITETGVVNKL